MCFFAICCGYWIGLRYLREGFEETCGRAWGVCAVGACCYGTLVVVMLLVCYGVLFYKGHSIRDSFADILSYMFGALVLMVWSLVQYSCLYVPYRDFRAQQEALSLERDVRALRRSGSTLTQLQIKRMRQAQRQREDEASANTRLGKCTFYGNLAGNSGLGVCFVVAEVFLIEELRTNAKAGSWKPFAAEMFVTLFLLCVMLLVIPMSANRLRHENKQAYTVAFFTFVPVSVLAGVYQWAKDSATVGDLSRMLLITIPLFALYLSTLNYVRKKSDNMYRAYLTVSGFGFILPLSLSYTLYYVDYYQFSSPLSLAGLVLFLYHGGSFYLRLRVSVTIVLVFAGVRLVSKILEARNQGYTFHESSFVDCGQLVNVSGGIVSVGALFYVYATCPSASTLKRSAVFAIAFLLLFLALCINMILRLKVPRGVANHNLDLSVLPSHFHSLFSEGEDPVGKKYGRERWLQKLVLIVGVVLLPLLLLVLYFAVSEEAEQICT